MADDSRSHPSEPRVLDQPWRVWSSVAVLGILMPGTPILMAVAAAAAMAGMPPMPVLVAAIAGAVIGDFVSYYLGHRYRFRLRAMWPFATRPIAPPSNTV